MRLDEIPANWVPPDGLGYSRLRAVRLGRGGYALAIAAAALVLGALVLAGVLRERSARDVARRDRLERAGVETSATILRLWRSGGEEDTHYVGYEFHVDGLRRAGSSRVPARIWRALRVRDRLPVRYLPDDHGINHPAGWRMDVLPAWLAILIPAVLLGISGMFAWLIGRQWRLLSEGRPAPGVIVKARRSDRQVVLTYEFRLLSGAAQRGRSSTSGRKVPGEGAPVCVIYDPENPRRSALYPLSLVRIEGGGGRR
ncbi:MAG: DUF3592 domain-containing protein [Acidobacteriota bacterium]|nr:DUF3592 domain-containing protein [Acidobacteriota bacterium]